MCIRNVTSSVAGNPRNLEAEILLRRRHFNRVLASLELCNEELGGPMGRGYP